MTNKAPHAAKTRTPKPKKESTQQQVPDLTTHPAVKAILGGSLIDSVTAVFTAFGWAEEEIADAQSEHPAHADRLWHASILLRPTHKLLYREPLYRPHAREILARVIARQDTRLATAAECLVACSELSLVAPLTSSAAGLFSRMWRLVGCPDIDGAAEHYEELHASTIDELETETRTRLRDDSRKLPRRIEHCQGCPEWEEPEEQLTLALPGGGLRPATA
ncbi:MAG TPA: hypothetical protein VGL78_04230 [Solirubrobacteraceae bacterium]|jgi:hypothetical protein